VAWTDKLCRDPARLLSAEILNSSEEDTDANLVAPGDMHAWCVPMDDCLLKSTTSGDDIRSFPK
jgi:hypothetical protein